MACALAAPHLRGPLAGAALFALAAEYAVAEATGHVPAGSVAGYAVALITMSELLLWAGQLPRSASADHAVTGQQIVTLAALVPVTAVLAAAVLATTGLRLPAAWTAALVGTAAASALLALPWLLLRGAGRSDPPRTTRGG